ncbi:MAG: hypothetical protein JWO94_2917 [Verrucomicrobiaceae bacterium]|nr:hypothetical protein [Verrucomicrobiaceae bacterium]
MHVFIDTNILVYAHDADAGVKHEKARELVTAFWLAADKPFISTQVVAELHVNLVRKLKTTVLEAAEIAALYLDNWQMIYASASLIHEAWEIQHQWQLSFWDAQMIAAARRANAWETWTEDLNHGQDYGGVTAFNPFNPFPQPSL